MFVIDLPFEIAALLILCIIVLAYFILKALVELLYALVVAIVDWWSTTAWPWIVDTATTVWDWVMQTSARAYERAKAKVQELADEIAKAIELLKTDRVYQLLMTVPGVYPKRTWGSGWNMTGHNYPQDCRGNPTFKYGTTNSTISARYSGDPVIGPLLNSGRVVGMFITPFMDRLQALATEKSLLIYYFGLYSQLPPGNSKFG